MREEVPVPADPDEDANVEVQRLKARLVQLESIHGRPPRGSVEAAENIRSKVAKRRGRDRIWPSLFGRIWPN